MHLRRQDRREMAEEIPSPRHQGVIGKRQTVSRGLTVQRAQGRGSKKENSCRTSRYRTNHKDGNDRAEYRNMLAMSDPCRDHLKTSVVHEDPRPYTEGRGMGRKTRLGPAVRKTTTRRLGRVSRLGLGNLPPENIRHPHTSMVLRQMRGDNHPR